MTTKLKSLILGISLIAAALSVGLCALANSADSALPLSSVSEEKVYYILKEHNSYLAIFGSDNLTSPIEILDVYVSDLPERDITKISQGIKADTLEEIISIAEDYE